MILFNNVIKKHNCRTAGTEQHCEVLIVTTEYPILKLLVITELCQMGFDIM